MGAEKLVPSSRWNPSATPSVVSAHVGVATRIPSPGAAMSVLTF